MNFVTRVLPLTFLAHVIAAVTIESSGVTNFPIGHDATMKCQIMPTPSADKLPIMSISWSKFIGTKPVKVGKSMLNANDTFVYNSAPEALKDRFSMSSDQFADGTAKAIISNVQIGDEGTYECEYEALKDSTSTNINVLVYSAPNVEIVAVENTLDIRPIIEEAGTETSETDESPTGAESNSTSEIPSTTAPATTTSTQAPASGNVTLATCEVTFAYPAPISFEFSRTPTATVWSSIPVENLVQNPDGTYNATGTLRAIPTAALDGTRIKCSVKLHPELEYHSTGETPPYVVYYEPTEVEISFNKYSPVEDELVKIECKTNGNPIGNAKLILPNGGTVSLPHVFHVAREDQGDYTCQVDVAGSEPITDSGFLTVHWLERPTLSNGAGKRTEQLGSTISITCNAKGEPAPTYTWYKKGQQISSGKTMQFNQLEYSDKGIYECEARGALILKTSVELDVVGGCAPVFTKIISGSTTPDNDVVHLEMNCYATGEPACLVQIKDQDNNELVKGDRAVQYVNDSFKKLMSSATYTCTAGNTQNSTTVNQTLSGDVIVNPEPSTSGVSTGVIVIIIILVALVVVGVPLGCYFVKKRNSPKSVENDKEVGVPAESEKLKPSEDGLTVRYESNSQSQSQDDFRLNNPKPMRTFSQKATA